MTGISLDSITKQLTEEGVKSFDGSFASLMSTIEARRDAVTRGLGDRQTAHLGSYQSAVDQTAQRAVGRVRARYSLIRCLHVVTLATCSHAVDVAEAHRVSAAGAALVCGQPTQPAASRPVRSRA